MKMIVLFIIVASGCFAQTSSSMNIIGKGELLTDEIIQDKRENRDDDGELCSVLMIEHNMSGLTYEGMNGIKRVVYDPGRDYIYISHTEKRLTVLGTGYFPLQIILRDVGINLRSGQTWRIRIRGDGRPLPSDVIPVNVITEPKGAEVFIDNVSKGTGTTFETSAGEHLLRVELKGYKSLETKVTVSTKNIFFNYKLTAIEQEVVEIRSVPDEAAIYLDGAPEGVTNGQVFRFPGRYKLHLTKAGYLDADREIEVKEGAVNKFVLSLVKNISSLKLKITPADAEVEINGKSYGQAGEIELAPGSHQLVVKKSGYRELREIVTLELNKPAAKTVTLEPVTGGLQVKAAPIEADVKLLKEGQVTEKWKGSKIIRNLIVGSYVLEAGLEGYEKSTKSIEIREG